MRELLTPKQVARAIQVSESSIKRWCDKGVIRTQYTAGGHRRITLSGLIEFLRESGHEIVDPEVIGLPSGGVQTTRTISEAPRKLAEALVAGDEIASRQLILDLYLAEHSISSIGDQVLATAFREIGFRWECGDAEIYQERRSCEIAARLMREMLAYVPTPPNDAPLAIGGAATGDYYSLPTLLIELVLRENGWNAISLGNNLPFNTLHQAIRDNHPRLFWLSCSYVPDTNHFVSGYQDLYEEYGKQCAFVIGGNALTDDLLGQIKFASHCTNMERLEDFVSSLMPSMR